MSMSFIIIGAGPVGLASAILLNKEGYQVTVYEGRFDIPNDPEQSYPIGINPRAIHTLKYISDSLADRASKTGVLVDAWQIYAGSTMVADLKSGSVIGTTRGAVNLLLYEEAIKHPEIKIEFGHRISSVNMESKSLTFTVKGRADVTIDASNSRVIAGDGVNSILRKAMEGRNGFTVTAFPWSKEFRVLFSSKGEVIDGLDTAVHYIFNGCYSAAILNEQTAKKRWTCVIGVGEDTPSDYKEVLSSNEPSEYNIKMLQQYLTENVPKMSKSFSPEDLEAYFSRRSFRGQVTEVNKLHHEEWLLLMGDAAHSVLPATGEGINSALEDASTLYELLLKKKETKGDLASLFRDYNEIRFPDTAALTQLAKYLNEQNSSAEAASRLVFTIVESILKKRGSYAKTHQDYCFGPEAHERVPYRTPLLEWQRRKSKILPWARLFMYPSVYLYKLIKLPFQIVYYTLASPFLLTKYLNKPSSKKKNDKAYKPTGSVSPHEEKLLDPKSFDGVKQSST